MYTGACFNLLGHPSTTNRGAIGFRASLNWAYETRLGVMASMLEMPVAFAVIFQAQA